MIHGWIVENYGYCDAHTSMPYLTYFHPCNELLVHEGARLACVEYKQKDCPDWPYGENENKTTPEQDSLFVLVTMALQRVPPSSSRFDSFYKIRRCVFRSGERTAFCLNCHDTYFLLPVFTTNFKSKCRSPFLKS